MGSVIETSREGRVLTIELARPHQLNALNSEVLSLLLSTVDGVQQDSSIGAVIIRERARRRSARAPTSRRSEGWVSWRPKRLFTPDTER